MTFLIQLATWWVPSWDPLNFSGLVVTIVFFLGWALWDMEKEDKE